MNDRLSRLNPEHGLIIPALWHSLTVSLIQYLREKDLLILFARCDYVRSACVQLVETILSTCPDVRILVTSHEPLGISAEKSYRVAI